MISSRVFPAASHDVLFGALRRRRSNDRLR
ncbi:hypothetical protein SAMN05444858_1335 [Micromonospora avicenniae]|uniref:Uncharacterized protein n=1 Tax=Micromonospora avicenniae TaxID=1198245 RepID=A0A1N7FBC4_9ACTN|nr:hypothetical protein SAMN05444858_1335 [Micromonospora avicenniae]